MQGRLSPRAEGRMQAFPWATWQDEFTWARDCGFDGLEWLVTADRLEENPIWTDAGVDQIRERMAATGVRVTSLCADCFISRPFVRVDEAERRSSIDTIETLIARSATLAIAVIVIPVLEAGEIRTRADAAVLRDSLRGPASLARTCGVRLALESDRAVAAYRELLDSMPPALGACYDVGNATALGFDVAADLRALGPHLCGIHIKDRRRGGPSVPLGEGDTDFDAVFDGLTAAGYSGPLVIETPVCDDPWSQARRHLAFVRDRLRARAAGSVPQ